MNIAKTNHVESQRRCKFPGCGNLFTGHHLQKFCEDPECIANRRKKYYETRKTKLQKQLKRKGVLNLILNTPKLKGRTVKINCAAKGVNGRCPHYFYVNYVSGQRVYPRFCEEHRNEYRRYRFENVKRNRNAEGTSASAAPRWGGRSRTEKRQEAEKTEN